ncbi:MAG: complex I NDUFA9 subunit family protein [Kordiimonas sp.]|nr:complex I NDUFA9 subunit family protein [Kordiimonas sp.]
MTARLVTVFGGSGFLGRAVVQHLAKTGARVRVAVRRPNSALFLKPLGDLGQIQIVQANLRDENSVRAAVTGADDVVNLVGLLYQTGPQKFDKIHARGAGLIAQASKEAGVKNLVHVSAIGADTESESQYARSKAAGEAAVQSAFPTATILRPSIIFGPNDSFFNRFAAMASLSPALPLICGETKFQPVYVGDVAAAVTNALNSPKAAGQIYELGGANIYTFKEILELILQVTQRKAILVPVPTAMAKVNAFFLGMLPKPLLTMDQVTLLEQDNVVSVGAAGLNDLGVTETPAEAILPTYLHSYRKLGQFAEE